jgi:hypothetical protein
VMDSMVCLMTPRGVQLKTSEHFKEINHFFNTNSSAIHNSVRSTEL